MHDDDIFAGLDSNLDETPEPVATKPMRGRFDTAMAARQYIRAGKATITLESQKTGAWFTYRVTEAIDKETGKPNGTLFVGLLNGPDNTTDYKYLGYIRRDVFWAGRKNPRPGDIGPHAPSSKAFAWAWRAIAGTSPQLPAQLKIFHEGFCGRCGRKLTVPASVKSGFGPECRDRLRSPV